MRRYVVAARFAIACGVIRVFARCGDVVGCFRGRVLLVGLRCNCDRVSNWCRFLGGEVCAVGSRPFVCRLRLPLLCVDVVLVLPRLGQATSISKVTCSFCSFRFHQACSAFGLPSAMLPFTRSIRSPWCKPALCAGDDSITLVMAMLDCSPFVSIRALHPTHNFPSRVAWVIFIVIPGVHG